MGLLLKNLNVGEPADKLGLDDKVADVLETLIAKAASLLK